MDKISDLHELGVVCLELVVDDPTSVTAAHKKIETLLAGQGLDILVNNAGKCRKNSPMPYVLQANAGAKNTAISRPAVESSPVEVQDVFGANVFGPMNMIRSFLPQLLRAKGMVVNIGSVAGILPLPFNAVYSASKAALYAYSETLRVELSPLGVKVIYVQTGNVNTNIIRERTQLEPTSLFAPVSDALEKQQKQAANSGMDPREFARQLANRICRRPPHVLWAGENALFIRILVTLDHYLPFRMWPYMFSKMFGLERLKA